MKLYRSGLTRTQQIKALSVSYLSLWVTAPLLAYGLLYRAAALLAILIWLTLELFNPNGVFLKPARHILVMALFLFYTLPIIYLSGETWVYLRFLQFYIILLFIIFATSHMRSGFDAFRPLVAVQIVLFTLWSVLTYLALLENSHAARFIGKSTEQAMEYQKSGVGGFAFVYATLVYIFGLMELIKYRIRRYRILSPWTLFMLFSLGMSILVILMAGYSTAVLLLVASLVLYFFHSDNTLLNIFLLFVVVLIYTIITINLIEILQWVQPYTYGTNYYIKVNDMITSLQYGEVTGTAADRAERYLRSTMLFLDHPLGGVWSFEAVGKHSFILDTLAQFGIFAGIALLYIILRIPWIYYKRYRTHRSYSFVMLFLVVALFGLNNVAMSYGFVFYIFYPTIMEITMGEKR